MTTSVITYKSTTRYFNQLPPELLDPITEFALALCANNKEKGTLLLTLRLLSIRLRERAKASDYVQRCFRSIFGTDYQLPKTYNQLFLLRSLAMDQYSFRNDMGAPYQEHRLYTHETLPKLDNTQIILSPNSESFAFTYYSSDSRTTAVFTCDRVEKRCFSHSTGSVYAIALSPDTRLLARAGKEGLHIFEKPNFATYFCYAGDATRLQTLLFSPDGQLLAGAGPSEISIHAIASRKVITWESKVASHRNMAFSPDGTQLLSNEITYLTLRNPRNGELIRKIEMPCIEPDKHVHLTSFYFGESAFAPDGNHFVATIRHESMSFAALYNLAENSWRVIPFNTKFWHTHFFPVDSNDTFMLIAMTPDSTRNYVSSLMTYNFTTNTLEQSPPLTTNTLEQSPPLPPHLSLASCRSLATKEIIGLTIGNPYQACRQITECQRSLIDGPDQDYGQITVCERSLSCWIPNHKPE